MTVQLHIQAFSQTDDCVKKEHTWAAEHSTWFSEVSL